MNATRDVIFADMRLYMLILLHDQGDFSLNDVVIKTALEQIGHRYSREVILGQLEWLKRMNLVTLDTVGRYTVATLTEWGDECVLGQTKVPGIRRPQPGEV
ncbi:MAG: ArsR family transcriptional regulator [Magnetococcales bacterium]|nr:ArsR family transcriptional regulator [Magnetococcales bacterium]